MKNYYVTRRGAIRRGGSLFGRGTFITLPEIVGQAVKLVTLSDGTFTRNSSASYHNGSTSSLAWVGPNILRSEDRNDGHGSLYLLEGASENLLQYSNDLTNAVWQKLIGATAVSDDLNAPDGADSNLVYLSGGDTPPNISRILQDAGQLTDGIDYATSFFLLRSGSTDRSLKIISRDGTGSQIGNVVSASVQWSRGTLVWTNASGANSNDARLSQDGLEDDYFYSAHAQLEVGSFPTSYISSSATTGSRAADSLIIPAAKDLGNILNNNRIRIDVFPYASSQDVIDGGATQYIAQKDGNNYILLLNSGVSARFRIRGGGATTITSDPVTFDRHQKVSLFIDASNGELTVSGANSGNTSVFGDPQTYDEAANYRIGATTAGTFPYFGRISDIYEASSDYLLDYNFSTFDRESEASWWDGSTLQWWASDEPRILSDGAIVIEGSRTNEIIYSEDYLQSAWSKSSGVTVTGNVSQTPDGETRADRIDFPASTKQVIDILNQAEFNTYGVSVFTQRPADSPSGSVTWNYLAQDLENFSEPIPADTTWKRTQFVGQSNSGSTSTRARFVSTEEQSLIAGGAQVESGSFVSSYIRTSGSETTRVADDCSFSSAPYEMRSGSWIIDAWPEYSSDDLSSGSAHYQVVAFDNTHKEGFYIRKDSNGIPICELWTGGAAAAFTASLSWDANEKLRFTHAGPDGYFAISSSTNGLIESSGLAAWFNTDGLFIGNRDTGTRPFYGKISRPWLSGTTPG